PARPRAGLEPGLRHDRHLPPRVRARRCAQRHAAAARDRSFHRVAEPEVHAPVHDAGIRRASRAAPSPVPHPRQGARRRLRTMADVLTPARIVPPARVPRRLAFIATFVRNPLEVIPRAVYEEDHVAIGRVRAWVTSPSIIKAVLLDERDKFRKLQQIRLLGPLLGKGILTSEGADWKWQRQASAPMFRPQTLGTFVPAFVRAAEQVLARWRAQPGVQPVDEDMTRATFEVISATLLPSAGDAFVADMRRSLRVLGRNGGWDMLYAAMNLPTWLPRPGMVRGYEALQALRRSVAQLLRERRDADGDNLLQRLVAARDPESGRAMDDQQLVDNLLTFYLAGHETTAKALTWTLYVLSRSPEWTERLEQEVERVTGGRPVAAEHIDRLAQ